MVLSELCSQRESLPLVLLTRIFIGFKLSMKLQQAAYLNQKGANMLAFGDYQGAYRIFAEAATILRDIDAVEQQEWQSPWPSISTVAGCRLAGLENSDFFIFNRDFQFVIVQPDTFSQAMTTACQKRFCVAIVLYNMALGRHAEAKTSGRDVHLEQALSLYSMSMDLLQNVRWQSDCINVLAIAALNNMAEASFELGEVWRAKTLLETITPLATSLCDATVAMYKVDECYINSLVTRFAVTARTA